MIKARYVGPSFKRRIITQKNWENDGRSEQPLTRDFVWPARAGHAARTLDVSDEPEEFIEMLREDPEFLVFSDEEDGDDEVKRTFLEPLTPVPPEE